MKIADLQGKILSETPEAERAPILDGSNDFGLYMACVETLKARQ